MKAIQIAQPGKVILTDLPIPAIQPDEVLVKIHYVGFCGSDLNTWLGRNALAKMPVIPGHEIGGTIEAVGDQVPASFMRGIPCTIHPYTACSVCSSCRNGRPNACRFNQTLGVQRDGAMCEFVAAPYDKIITDTDLTPMDCCLIEPMSVGFHAVERGKVTERDTVMTLGCGMIGIGAIVSAALRGARVIAVDVDDDKLALAKQIGATLTINSQTENVHERLQAITGNSGPDIIIEAVGAPATYLLAVSEVAFTGRIVCIGYAKENIALETRLFVQKELDILGSRNALPEDFRAVIAFIKKGIFPKEAIISDIYPPEKAQDALERWNANPGKVFRLLIDFSRH